MKNGFKKKESENGVVLLIVLIVVSILTILVVDFIYFTQIDTTISANARDEIKAHYIAKSGVEVVAGTIRDRTLEELTEIAGTLGEEGDLSEGYWVIKVPSFPIGEGVVSVIVSDERSKVNLNALVKQSTNRVSEQVKTELAELFRILGVEDGKSSLFIASLTNWLDHPIQSTGGNQFQNDKDPLGADADFYAGLDNPYRIKDGPLDSLKEILLIEGMDEEFFDKIKNYVTVYPKDGEVNFSTASKVVMMAVLKTAAATAGGQGDPGTDLGDEVAQSIAEAIIEERKNDPVISQQKVQQITLQYVDQEDNFNSALPGVVLNDGKSEIFSVKSIGNLEGENPTIRVIEVVVRKSDSGNSKGVNIVSWKER